MLVLKNRKERRPCRFRTLVLRTFLARGMLLLVADSAKTLSCGTLACCGGAENLDVKIKRPWVDIRESLDETP